jgi:hypothetical protein
VACPKCGKQSPSEEVLCDDCLAKKNSEKFFVENENSDNSPFGSLDWIVGLFSFIFSFIVCFMIDYKFLGFHRWSIKNFIAPIVIIIMSIIVYALCSKIWRFIRNFLS